MNWPSIRFLFSISFFVFSFNFQKLHTITSPYTNSPNKIIRKLTISKTFIYIGSFLFFPDTSNMNQYKIAVETQASIRCIAVKYYFDCILHTSTTKDAHNNLSLMILFFHL